MKIHKYERIFLSKKYAHNITQYEVKKKKTYFNDDVFTISHIVKVRIYCLLMMFVDHVGN